MYKILEKKTLNANTKQMIIHAPHVAKKALPGQFIILRVDEEGERIPLTIASYDREQGTIMIIFQEVGATTKQLGLLNVGDCLHDFVGPLGRASELEGLKKWLWSAAVWAVPLLIRRQRHCTKWALRSI